MAYLEQAICTLSAYEKNSCAWNDESPTEMFEMRCNRTTHYKRNNNIIERAKITCREQQLQVWPSYANLLCSYNHRHTCITRIHCWPNDGSGCGRKNTYCQKCT